MSVLTRPLGLVHRVYVAGETGASAMAEAVVGSGAFGELLAISASNAMATMRHANGGLDRGIRALRVAGREDVTGLGRQLARTEDKLERMLQLVEELGDRLDRVAPSDPAPPAPPDSATVASNGHKRSAKRPRAGASAPGPSS